jgi:hypothetical protein
MFKGGRGGGEDESRWVGGRRELFDARNLGVEYEGSEVKGVPQSKGRGM